MITNMRPKSGPWDGVIIDSGGVLLARPPFATCRTHLMSRSAVVSK